MLWRVQDVAFTKRFVLRCAQLLQLHAQALLTLSRLLRP
tara:strand:- start:220 stop:336 length:117 start_codon:yes stop_codon:yes gene_type:complete